MKIDDTLRLLSLTQAEINAITSPDTAGLLYNSTTSTVQFYNGSSWTNAGGGGGGDLLASNNLSDVANAATSLGNLNGEPAFAKNTAFNKDFGTIAGTVLEGDKNAAIVLNTAKVSNVTTNLSLGPISSTTMDVNSSDGTNVTLTEADATFAGVMPAAKFNEVTANNAKVTNATHTGEVTGSGSLTVDPTAISNKATVTAAAGMEVLVNDAGTLKKADASDFLGGGGGGWTRVTEATATRTAAADEFILVNAATCIITLPAPVDSVTIAVKAIVVPTDIQIKTSGVGINIDGTDYSSTGLELKKQWEQISLISDGTDWFIY